MKHIITGPSIVALRALPVGVRPNSYPCLMRYRSDVADSTEVECVILALDSGSHLSNNAIVLSGPRLGWSEFKLIPRSWNLNNYQIISGAVTFSQRIIDDES